ncbi:FMRFamide receptor [Ditylenchus destructor]|nr:FMRFamide receptor [Ditylenchus destructor]
MLRHEMTASEYVSCALVIYIQPVICLMGLVFNCACVAVFVKVNNHEYYRKTSLIFYLTSLNLCNILQLMLSILVIVFPALEQFMDDEKFPQEYRILVETNAKTVRFAYPLLMAANYASIWILTLICAQRFHSICHPASPWKNHLNFVRRSKLCVALSVALAIVINVVRLWELQPVSSSQGDLGDSTLRSSIWYKVVQEGFVYGLIVYGLPMLMLLWLNYNTFKIVLADDLERCRPVAEHRTALMTFTVFVFFFLFTTMSVTLRLIMILSGDLFLHPEYVWMVDLSNLLMNANALAMPVICFLFTRGFRDLFFAVRHVSATSDDPSIIYAQEAKAIKPKYPVDV